MSSAQQRSELIAAIRALPSEVERLVADLSAEQLTARPIDGEWSIAQNVHHLVDSHINSYVRCKLMVTEEQPEFRPYDEAAWGELPDATSADLSHSLAILHHLHERWVLFWQSLNEAQWQRTGYHPADKVFVTLEKQLELYVDHGRAHIEQMQRNITALQ